MIRSFCLLARCHDPVPKRSTFKDMVEEDVMVTEAAETMTNGAVSPDKEMKDAIEKKEEKKEEVDKMAVDAKDDGNGKNKEAEKADADVSEKEKEEEKDEEVKDNKEEGDEKEEPMEVDDDKEVPNEETENKDTKVADTKEEEENKEEEVPEEKGSKKRSHKKGGGEKSNTKTKTPAEKIVTEEKVPEKKKEPTTPVTPTIDRSVRERKSVERWLGEQDIAKEFHIGKGRGAALKDIPNVAYKFSKRKLDESLKQLHTILFFGRRGKAYRVKTNILQFSGFVWPENEEMQKLKVKEKLDKYNKEKLMEYCNLFDLKVRKSMVKDDIVVKLLDFMLTPHATTSELLAEKDQSSKGKKRPRSSKKSTSSSGATPSKSSSKKTKNTSEEKKKTTPETDESSKEEEQEDDEEKETEEHEDTNGAPENSEDEKTENAASEEEHATLNSLKRIVRGVTPKKSAAKEKSEISSLGNLQRQVMAKDMELANKEQELQKMKAELASLRQKQEQWVVEKKVLEERVDSLEHHLREVQMDKGTREEVEILESEKIKLSSRTPEICYNCYELFVSPHLLVPLEKFQDRAICLGGH